MSLVDFGRHIRSESNSCPAHIARENPAADSTSPIPRAHASASPDLHRIAINSSLSRRGSLDLTITGRKTSRSHNVHNPSVKYKLTQAQKARCKYDEISVKERNAGYFFVHKIVAHRINGENQGRLEFLIKWYGFKKRFNSWEPLQHLDRCQDLLREYKEKHPDVILPENIERMSLVGASSNTSSNADAWISVGRVIDIIKARMTKIFKGEPFPVFQFKLHLGETDALYVLEFEHHAFIVLFFAKFNMCLIADGENLFIKDKRISAHIRAMIGTSARGIEYKQAYYGDTCGGAAACIGLEMLRMYNSSKLEPHDWPDSLFIKNRLKNEIFRQEYNLRGLNPLPNTTPNISKRIILKCDDCDWSTTSTNRSTLTMHRYNNH